MKYIKLRVPDHFNDFRIVTAFELIGKHDNKGKAGTKQKSYKNGRMVIKRKLLEKNILVTNRELKMFARLVKIPMNNHSIQRISSNTIEILQTIYEQIHASEPLIKYCSYFNNENKATSCKESLFCNQERSIITNSESINKILYTRPKDDRDRFNTMLGNLYLWDYHCP